MANKPNRKKIEVWKNPDGSYEEIGRIDRTKKPLGNPRDYEQIRVVHGENFTQATKRDNPIVEVLWPDTYEDWTFAQVDDHVRQKYGNISLHLQCRPNEGGYWKHHVPRKLAKYVRNDEVGNELVQIHTRISQLESENAQLKSRTVETEAVVEAPVENFLVWGRRWLEEMLDTLGEPLFRELLNTISDPVVGGLKNLMQPNIAQQTIEPSISDAPANTGEQAEAYIPDQIWNEIYLFASEVDWDKTNIPALAAWLSSKRTDPELRNNPLMSLIVKFKTSKAA